MEVFIMFREIRTRERITDRYMTEEEARIERENRREMERRVKEAREWLWRQVDPDAANNG